MFKKNVIQKLISGEFKFKISLKFTHETRDKRSSSLFTHDNSTLLLARRSILLFQRECSFIKGTAKMEQR